MYYYAVIDTTTGICTFVYESETEIVSADHVQIDELDTSYLFRKKYIDGVWYDTTPEEAMQYNGMHVAIFGRWLDEVLNDKSEIDHTHTEYAMTDHTHDGYASSDDLALLEDVVATKADATHTHTEYSLADHVHSDYALQTDVDVLSEEVDGKADVNHTHDNYALTSHTHTASEVGAASSDHNHDADYADASHNHDTVYSTIGHDHNESYANLNHAHADYATVTSVDALEEVVSEKADSAHTHADYALVSHSHTEYSPTSHNHDNSYATLSHSHSDYVTTTSFNELSTTVSGKADATHTHAISDITNLQTTLDGKAASSHGAHVTYSTTAPVMDGTASVGTASTVARSDHKHPTDTSRASQTDLDSLETVVAGKANSSHTHTIANITNLQTTLDGKAASSHTHTVANISDLTATATELNYIDGVTSNVQTQLDAKQATITGGASTITSSNLTTNRALISDSSGKVAVSAVTSTELGYLDGVTSNVQTQLDGKAASSHNHSASNITSGTLSSDRLPTVPISKGGTGATTAAAALTNLGITATASELNKLDGVTVTTTELNYIDGVTSNIQTQLNNKSNTSHTHSYAGSSSVGGSATSANKLATARTISLVGDVSGSTSFDGSGNVSMTTVVADDSHNHTISNVDGLQSSLDAKLSTSGGTVGNLIGSGTITSNGTLSGNNGTQTPFSTTTNLYYVNKKLSWNTSSYIQHVILLLPVLTSSNWFGLNYIDGKFMFWKGGANVYDVVEINANCVYNVLKYHLEFFGDHPTWELCICTYNGVSYYALNCPYHANPYTNVDFVGHIKSELAGGTSTVALPLDIAYYNENTSTVLNQEVYESITTTLTTTYVTSVSGTPLHSKNGFAGSLSGNAATATKLANARTISLTGDVTGSVSFDGSANASITATVADDSHNHTIANVDGLQTALNGKSATSHNHDSTYISKDLQMTDDDGNAELKLASGSSDNLLTKIAALGMGMHTFYSASGNAGNPKTTEAWRGIIFKTGTNYGFVQAYGSIGSVYTNYLDGSNSWRGWKCIYDVAPSPLWSGQMYMTSTNGTPQTVTPSKTLSECCNGWLLLWSDYDPGDGANDADFVTTMIPKRTPSGGTWGGKSFLCDIPRYTGSDAEDVDTERRIIKPIYVHDDCIKGSYQNAYDERNDVVLRAIYEF